MFDKTVVLLVNLGTPRSASNSDVKTYLNEFLTDGRVIDIPWLARQLLVRGVIVPRRYKESAGIYRQLWTENGSPLLHYGKEVRRLLQDRLGERFVVRLAMRYQEPSLLNELECIRKEGYQKIVVLPLFPQYASATTGSVHQRVMETVSTWRNIPECTLLQSYPEQKKMIQAIAEQAKKKDIASYDHYIFSFHGLPESQLRKSDDRCLKDSDCCKRSNSCYRAQCYRTARAIIRELDLEATDCTVAFQSRLGSDPWIKPYAEDLIKTMPKKGKKKLLVFSPAFVSDCLETTIEIGVEYAHLFRECGGDTLDLVESLNDHPLWIEALEELVLDSVGQTVTR
ncbi:MAG: ferrochelatase [Waddliaceae bacterium]|nr:ferrochelatase [Waddliaceae bacterium]